MKTVRKKIMVVLAFHFLLLFFIISKTVFGEMMMNSRDRAATKLKPEQCEYLFDWEQRVYCRLLF
jgi:hypothetical protein